MKALPGWKPFCSVGGVDLYHADAREVLPSLPSESADLTVTDPPYGAGWESGFRAESFGRLANDGADARSVIRDVLTECVRLTGQKRHLYVFGPADVLSGQKVAEPVELIWDKGRPGMGDLARPWGPQHERLSFTISMFRHGGKVGEVSAAARIRKGSTLRFPARTGRKVRHPSEKPVSLLRELIESSSRQGELVLDPFAGICSTGVAAILTGRQAVLVEESERWCEVGAQRLIAAAKIWTDGAAV